MGDADFATAMVPPSPPRNMSEMALPANTGDLRSNAPPANAGIAAAPQGRRKGNPPTNAPVVPTGSNKEKDAKRGGAAVPKLKIATGEDSDEDEIQYEYSVPLSERETALTARDRDLIERGDWSEIHDELSDNDFSLIGNRGGDGQKHVMISSFQKGGKGPGQGVTIAPMGSGAVAGAIHNPRGGRHFRSPQAATEDAASSAAPAAQAPARNPSQLNFKNHSGGFQIEDSDEDSAAGNAGASNKSGGKKGGNSPRRAVDRLDPIPMPLYDEPGVLSGRRIEKPNLSARGNAGGYAPI